ncbi:thioredoxin-like protein [Lasiosphaeria hispida]|uniref:Thioredoxin-like protein n=1 Tax=Lasiosphaeria hispida TaxID=260671 RepID=A0AAJ0MJP0_9PEZI|nr:thioredoxin-like protein [Lasiosphaeria hispida]
MPSPRRVRLLFFVVLGGFMTLLFFTSHYRHTRDADPRSKQDFYHKTVNALEREKGAKSGGSTQQIIPGHDHDADGDIDEEDVIMARKMADQLKAAEQKAKEAARAKGPNKPDSPNDVVGVGSSASGQHKKDAAKGEDGTEETEEDHEVVTELNAILKKSPVIIFSKSYCPHSKRAKGILLEKYLIDPTPYVVELDQHPLGPKIQQKLAEMTGRATVPNVMIYGISIGGGDDIAALDKEKKLADKIKDIGGKRIDVAPRFVVSKAG